MSPAVNPSTPDLRASLAAFAQWRREKLKGDEKGEAQPFLDRLFRAFGHEGVQDAGAEFESRLRRREDKGTGFADLMWKPRVLIEMKKAGTPLRKHYRQAFDYWVRAVPDRPRYVVLCNFDEFWVYDFENQLDEPVDVVTLDELPQRWEVLGFMLPREVKPVFGNDLVQVTREAAAEVARVFTSMKARGVTTEVAQRFVLQCVMAMFSEDIGLLPRHSFTEAISDAHTGAEAFDLIGGLFREMNTPGKTAGGRYQGTPYFNGGLFAHIHPQELTTEELDLLREASQTNWAEVRPEIFGTLFEGSMDAGERHARGAHFTSQADIARIVGPCIVDPWRERIDSATTIPQLQALLDAMAIYKVLDPACGSGNFLYVAYRELRRLEHEIAEKIAARRTGRLTVGQTALRYVDPENFLGIDNNPFAVEVAKVTMQLGKKLAADELGDEGTVLPLDNLDGVISCSDALFSPWPRADVIIGNPPYLGNRRMVDELGGDYVARLNERYPARGVADFVTYWFPKAHDHLPEGGRAGFVATNSVRQGDSRKASLDYVTDHDGVIFDAVSSVPWSGDAVVHVSIVNWQKGGQPPVTRTLWLDEGQHPVEVAEISSSLSPRTDLRTAQIIKANDAMVFQGQTSGASSVYEITSAAARSFLQAEPADAEVIHPVLGGKALLHRTDVEKWIIDIPVTDAGDVWARYPKLMAYMDRDVLPLRQEKAEAERQRNEAKLASNPAARLTWPRRDFMRQWWRLWRSRPELAAAVAALPRYIALTRTTSFERGPVFTFVDGRYRVTDSIVAFPFADDYSLGILQAAPHVAWYRERCTTMKVDPNYTTTTVSDTFPWPQDPTPEAVQAVAEAAAAIVDHRAKSFAMGVSLAAQYDVLRRPGRSQLRDLHAELDAAVMDAYGFDAEADVLAQLLALNHLVAERERAGDPVTRPGPTQNAGMVSDWAFPAPTL
ncbi:DNA methyltransferase [Georgenia thermotolerans]|uniref:DNA methyltransferase n=1 Tax=Georgenia thermotolerans TaxID=527326 RepID=UPI001B8C3AF9|nr:DNA methyltransferase [Georgenia thermotolerans]